MGMLRGGLAMFSSGLLGLIRGLLGLIRGLFRLIRRLLGLIRRLFRFIRGLFRFIRGLFRLIRGLFRLIRRLFRFIRRLFRLTRGLLRFISRLYRFTRGLLRLARGLLVASNSAWFAFGGFKRLQIGVLSLLPEQIVVPLRFRVGLGVWLARSTFQRISSRLRCAFCRFGGLRGLLRLPFAPPFPPRLGLRLRGFSFLRCALLRLTGRLVVPRLDHRSVLCIVDWLLDGFCVLHFFITVLLSIGFTSTLVGVWPWLL